MEAHLDPTPPLRRNRVARLGVFTLIAIGTLVAYHSAAVLDPIALAAAARSSPAAPLGFVAIHIAASILFVPRTLLAVAAGLLFGVGWGIVWAEIGSVAGAVVGFLIARYINSGLIQADRCAQIKPILERVERGGWRAVAMLRLIPVVPHSLGNYALGLTRLPLAPYAFGSLAGQLPMTIAYVELGAAGGRLALGHAGWLEPTLIGIVMLGLSLAIPAYLRGKLR
jgi:uncharacterized membrane protein YdjX (TVP38/TMEM64 family)